MLLDNEIDPAVVGVAARSVVNAFRRGLSEAGYVEHRNVGIDYSWAEDRPDRLPALAAELVSRQVTVIAATGGPQSAILIVFVVGSDPGSGSRP